MKIIATNIGKSEIIEWKGEKVKTGIFKYPVNKPVYLGKDDVSDDCVADRKHHGGTDKACYLYSADHYNYWKEKYPDIDLPWGTFGENLTVEGLFEDRINIGDIFQAGNAWVQVTQPRQPCFKLQFRIADRQIAKKFIESGFPGIYVRVIKEGEIKTGDKMKLTERQEGPSVHDIHKLLFSSDADKELLAKALQNPYIAQSCKNDLKKKWKINI